MTFLVFLQLRALIRQLIKHIKEKKVTEEREKKSIHYRDQKENAIDDGPPSFRKKTASKKKCFFYFQTPKTQQLLMISMVGIADKNGANQQSCYKHPLRTKGKVHFEP